jgi:hypothetical protein
VVERRLVGGGEAGLLLQQRQQLAQCGTAAELGQRQLLLGCGQAGEGRGQRLDLGLDGARGVDAQVLQDVLVGADQLEDRGEPGGGRRTGLVGAGGDQGDQVSGLLGVVAGLLCSAGDGSQAAGDLRGLTAEHLGVGDGVGDLAQAAGGEPEAGGDGDEVVAGGRQVGAGDDGQLGGRGSAFLADVAQLDDGVLGGVAEGGDGPGGGVQLGADVGPGEAGQAFELVGELSGDRAGALHAHFEVGQRVDVVEGFLLGVADRLEHCAQGGEASEGLNDGAEPGPDVAGDGLEEVGVAQRRRGAASAGVRAAAGETAGDALEEGGRFLARQCLLGGGLLQRVDHRRRTAAGLLVDAVGRLEVLASPADGVGQDVLGVLQLLGGAVQPLVLRVGAVQDASFPLPLGLDLVGPVGKGAVVLLLPDGQGVTAQASGPALADAVDLVAAHGDVGVRAVAELDRLLLQHCVAQLDQLVAGGGGGGRLLLEPLVQLHGLQQAAIVEDLLGTLALLGGRVVLAAHLVGGAVELLRLAVELGVDQCLQGLALLQLLLVVVVEPVGPDLLTGEGVRQRLDAAVGVEVGTEPLFAFGFLLDSADGVGDVRGVDPRCHGGLGDVVLGERGGQPAVDLVGGADALCPFAGDGAADRDVDALGGLLLRGRPQLQGTVEHLLGLGAGLVEGNEAGRGLDLAGNDGGQLAVGATQRLQVADLIRGDLVLLGLVGAARRLHVRLAGRRTGDGLAEGLVDLGPRLLGGLDDLGGVGLEVGQQLVAELCGVE